jgi:DNA repair protein RadA
MMEGLRRGGVSSAFQLALARPSFVADLLKVSYEEARRLIEEAASLVGVERQWLSLIKPRAAAKVTTGSFNLDSLLGGGVEVGGIVEVYGAFATGKTQLCHQLCVNVQLPRAKGGLEAKAAYIDADGSFRPERVKAMAEALGLDPSEALRNVLVFKPSTVEEQVAVVEEVKRLAERVKLLAVDTVISLFRAEFGEDVVARQWRLLLHLKQLEALAELGVAVVLANQVVVKPGVGELPAGGVVLDAGLTKVKLSRHGGLWRAMLEASPYLPEGEALFRITGQGVRDP